MRQTEVEKFKHFSAAINRGQKRLKKYSAGRDPKFCVTKDDKTVIKLINHKALWL